jgi:hypothetical protein
MDERYEQPVELPELISQCFGEDSAMAALTINTLEAAADLGPETASALEFGLRPHLEALAGGVATADPEQLTNYLRYFELTATRIAVTDHSDPLGRIERDFNSYPHVREGTRLRVALKEEPLPTDTPAN